MSLESNKTLSRDVVEKKSALRIDARGKKKGAPRGEVWEKEGVRRKISWGYRQLLWLPEK